MVNVNSKRMKLVDVMILYNVRIECTSTSFKSMFSRF